MFLAGLVILAGFGLVALFAAVDSVGLPSQNAIATVVGREYRDVVKGYRTTILNDTPWVVPHTTAEKFLLQLDIGGQRAVGNVSRLVFEAVKTDDEVQVIFQRRRLTGLVRVVDVNPL